MFFNKHVLIKIIFNKIIIYIYMFSIIYVIVRAGIIRGVDMERQEVFINTPLPISIMQYVNCLAGCIATPPALLELSQGAPYVGEKATLPTSREPHRKYFRIRHQNRSNKS